ncbi:uncharacterized protein LOC122659126 [Telopea speciosissima]|uniref:uncharacterized protein LOC122659126 n=1 Tax=Telopea speciosissima TaxID=54955 RepID=UPI001CC63C60|nr:uncharacterized protein LOC122659126 [Telopea speciosissima]
MGEVVAGFASFYGDCSNDIVELRALRDGLKMCERLGYTEIQANSDSTATIMTVMKGRHGNWKGWYWMQEIQVLINRIKPKISFTYREGNRAADYLASLACEQKRDLVFHGENQLPQELRRITREEALGLAVICF